MRVGIDIHTLGRRQTGNETYVRGLMEGLATVAAADVEHVYYRTDGVAPSAPARSRRVWPHNRFVRIPISFPIVLLRDRVDVAHFQYIAPPWCPCPTVVSIHDVSYEFHPEFFSPFERARLRALIPLSLRGSAHVLTLSQFSRAQIIECYGVPADQISVTPLAPRSRFARIDERDELRRTIAALGVREPYLLAVGNLQPRKNLERLLAAYAALRRSAGIPHQMVLVGREAFQGSRIGARARALGVEGSVVLTGYVSDVQLVALYNLADVFVYPSLYEGFGLPVLEAMACGTPVIASNVASMPEVAGDAALLVDPRDEAAIAAAMERLVGSPELRRELQVRGLERARAFTWRRLAEQTLAVYRAAAGGPARAAGSGR